MQFHFTMGKKLREISWPYFSSNYFINLIWKFIVYTNLPSADYKSFDPMDLKSENYFEREYFSSQNGTYHLGFN